MRSHAYAEGQVWEYRTRPIDVGSLLRIQNIEAEPAFARQGLIYHISIIGLHITTNEFVAHVLEHAPVSKQTLDMSVTRLSSSTAVFPDARNGIAEWRTAHGGVFTISVAKIVDAMETLVRSKAAAAKSPMS